MFGDRTKAVLFHALTFRPPQMRSENHARAVFCCILDCRNRGADARVVFDVAVFDGNVEIDADENALACEIKILDGKLWHCSVLSRAVCGELNADYPTLYFVAFRVISWIESSPTGMNPQSETAQINTVD